MKKITLMLLIVATISVAHTKPAPTTVKDAFIEWVKAVDAISKEMKSFDMPAILSKKMAIPDALIEKAKTAQKAHELLRTFFPEGITEQKLKAALQSDLGCLVGCYAITCDYCGSDYLCYFACIERRESCIARCAAND